MHPAEEIFKIRTASEFTTIECKSFKYQHALNPVYRAFCDALGTKAGEVSSPEAIPFLPIEFFKTHEVSCEKFTPQAVFLSSGTTGMTRSRRLVADLETYRRSLFLGFERYFGEISGYQFLALTPSPSEAPHSSLVWMIRELMERSGERGNGFFLHDHEGLRARLREPLPAGKKRMLIGLAYALLDFAGAFPGRYHDLIVVETGGMKGNRPEMIREELHSLLCPAFGVDRIHSEYGMTELLSQAWSLGDGLFTTPPWMQVLIREVNDPLSYARPGETGGINIIDLACRDACCFIATQDLGRIHPDGHFEVLGRFDNSEARGCSLMM